MPACEQSAFLKDYAQVLRDGNAALFVGAAISNQRRVALDYISHLTFDQVFSSAGCSACNDGWMTDNHDVFCGSSLTKQHAERAFRQALPVSTFR